MANYLCGASVNDLGSVGRDGLDDAGCEEFLDGHTGKRPIDSQTIDKDRGRDELVCGDFLQELVMGRLVKHHGIVGLVLDFAFGPLLLLLLSTR
jgi:hypothetical protein